MDNKIIIDTFYNYVLPGILEGEVDCDYLLHILFNVTIGTETYMATKKYGIENIPTLYIGIKEEFDDALARYTTVALEFYQEKIKNIPEDKRTAYIEALVFVPMGQKDYLNPVEYLNKMVSVLSVCPIDLTDGYVEYGIIPSLQSEMSIKIDKETPNEEAPFKFMIKLDNESETYSLQTVRFYIHDDKVYIGAIQHEQKREVQERSKIKRRLFKANENADVNSEIIETNPGSVASLSVFFSYMNAKGYKEYHTLPTNVQRRIDKCILVYNLNNILEINKPPFERRHKVVETLERANGYFERSDTIRKQLRNAFARIAYHFDVVDFYEDEKESEDTTIISEEVIGCNNRLLGELYTTISEEQKKLT